MKKVLFLEYPKCSTCQKAKRWLDENGVVYDDRHIVENQPTVAELKTWLSLSGGDIKKLFNTSGLKYKALNLKEKLPNMSDEEQIELLATDGMLVKRPLLVGDDFVVAGFKPEIWQNKLNTSK